MKTVAFSVIFSVISLASFAQTDSVRANEIIASAISFEPARFGKHIDTSYLTGIAVNDCLVPFAIPPTKDIADPLQIAIELFLVIREEVGTKFKLDWADCLHFKYFADHPRVIVFILESPNGRRMKINIFATTDYKIRFVTLYRSTCTYF